MRHLFARWLLILALLPAGAVWAQDAEVFMLGRTQVQFAGLPAAKAALAAEDVWTAATSDFQRAATMGVTGPVAPERFREHLANAAVAWTPPQQERWRKALAALAPKFEALRVPLPAQVLLVQTNGTDAANAPYTRANVVFLPAGLRTPHTDAELMAHELFHIVTRYDPALATRLYAELGFESAGELAWPAQWLPARIANPDAPHSGHFMTVEMDGKPAAVMPLLVARRTTLNPGETFFHVLDVRLLAIEPGTHGRPSRAVTGAEGQPRWMPAQSARQYLARLGGNTSYIFHPEETAADNFAFLVSGRPVPNPQLLQRLEAVFLAPR